ncbi:MAG: hypothetical protein ABIT38_18600, partial [Gemmatimonadaceae bacterium]
MKWLRLPHPIILLVGGIVVAALMTWILPAGEFQRRDDPVTGRNLVVAGTYHAVERAPVGALGVVVAVPRGMVAAAEVLISILLVGGAFALVEQLGTLRRGVDVIVRRFHGRGLWVIPLVAGVFTTFGALENMQEEIIPLIPVLLILGRGLGVDAIAVIAMSTGAAAIGAAFGPTNPYVAGIALKLAQLPLLSGGGLRVAMWIVGIVIWVAWTMWYAHRHRLTPEASEVSDGSVAKMESLTARDGTILAIILSSFGLYVFGVLKFDWGFNELSAIFFFAAIIIGLVGRLTLSDSVTQYLAGMQTVTGAALLVGVARGISVVLTDGRVIDTIVNGLALPLTGKSPTIAALLMIAIHGVIHIAVPSNSAQAALTMPVLVPVSDLIGLSRQVTV